MKKGQIGLSVNAIIVIIISIILFSIGMALIFKFVNTGEETQALLNEQIINAIEGRLIQQNKLVTLPFNSAQLETGDSKVFGIGFRNIEATNDFSITISVSTGSPMQSAVVAEWFLYDDTPINLEENAIGNSALRVQVPNDAEAGQYIFNVEVEVNGQKYGNRQKINIEVR